MKSEYTINYGIYPALLGIDNPNGLIEKVNEIQFIDTKTQKQIHSQKITA